MSRKNSVTVMQPYAKKLLYDAGNGIEHFWGIGHLAMKVGSSTEALRAAGYRTDSVGLSIGRIQAELAPTRTVDIKPDNWGTVDEQDHRAGIPRGHLLAYALHTACGAGGRFAPVQT